MVWEKKQRKGIDNSLPPIKQKITKTKFGVLYQEVCEGLIYEGFLQTLMSEGHKKYNTFELLNN